MALTLHLSLCRRLVRPVPTAVSACSRYLSTPTAAAIKPAAKPTTATATQSNTTKAAKQPAVTPVALAHDKIRLGVKGSGSDNVQSCILAHCLLGNRGMWNKRFTQQLDILLKNHNIKLDIYFVDLRNHGETQHTPTHTYNEMAADLELFIRKYQLKRPFLAGFSMGGKACMATILQYMNLQSCAGLISLDCSPAQYTHTHQRFFDAAKAINFATIHSIADADKQLVRYLPRIDERTFLLSNITKQAGTYQWLCNIDVLQQYEHEIHAFNVPRELQWTGPALFIGGSDSSRLTLHEYKRMIPVYFPSATIEMIQSGHFVHQEQPYSTAALMAEFIAKNTPKR